MHTVEEIIEQARHLSSQDQRRLVEELEAFLAPESEVAQPSPTGPYAQSLALAGTAHTAFPDVSADKYKHLAEAYVDRHDDQ
jgi:hypothetical protein